MLPQWVYEVLVYYSLLEIMIYFLGFDEGMTIFE